MVDVSIIFVNYKTPVITKAAIESVIEKSSGFTYEMIVVDNSNSESDFQELSDALKGLPNVNVINANGNLGFGKANNLGSEHANGKYLHFLNTDTLLVNNAVYELFAFLEKHNDVGIAGSNLYTKDMLPNHSFIPVEKNLKYEKKYNSVLYSLKKKISKKRIDFNYEDKPLELKGYCCGASFMMRKDDFESLGGFDKDIFMYAEEALLNYRLIHELHKKIYNIPSSKIIHLDGGSTGSGSHTRSLMVAEGTLIYYKKAFGLETAIKYLKFHLKNFRRKYKLAVLVHNKQQENFFKDNIEIFETLLNEQQKECVK